MEAASANYVHRKPGEKISTLNIRIADGCHPHPSILALRFQGDAALISYAAIPLSNSASGNYPATGYPA